MRKLAAVMLAVAGLWTTAGPAGATHVASGNTCGFWSVTDSTAEPGVQFGQISGGPVTATNTPATVTVKCTLQVGSATHSGVDNATVAATGSQSATVPATFVNYLWDVGLPVYLCTEWTVTDVSGTATYYYDGATFSTSSAVSCVQATGPIGPTNFFFVSPTSTTV